MSKITSIDDLSNEVRIKLMENQRELTNQWEVIAEETENERSRLGLREGLFKKAMVNVKKSFDLKVMSFESLFESQVHARMLEIYQTEGPYYFIKCAKLLKTDSRVIDFDCSSGTSGLDVLISEQFNTDFESF